MTDKQIGKIEWHDLTIADAKATKDFYARVVGWHSSPVSMGEYDDFNMHLPGSEDVTAGICHARGANADLPPVWMMYVRVENVSDSIQAVTELGGKVLKGPSHYAGDDYYVVQDPAGAVLTLFGSG